MKNVILGCVVLIGWTIASATDWVDIVGRANVAAIYSDTTLLGSGWTGYYRADGRGFIVQANGSVQGRRWFVQSDRSACAALDEGPTLCFRFQHERGDEKHVRVIEVGSGQQFVARVEPGLPDLSRFEQAAAVARDDAWRRALADPRELSTELREEVVRIPLRNAPDTGLVATLFQPQGSGPFPVIVLNHGSPFQPQDRARLGRYRLLSQTRALVSRGYAVLVPMRRGYGASPGPYAEEIGRCEAPQYEIAGEQAARDVLSAVDWTGTRPSLDAHRIILMGQSAGGFAALAAAARAPSGVLAVINLAGGRGGNGRDGIPCAPDVMAAVLAGYGRTMRVPTLWIYAENDHYFGPQTSSGWFKAFAAAGGKGRFALQPAIGVDGHLLFYKDDALDMWSKTMDDFLHAEVLPR